MDHTVAVLREVRRVLRKDGTVWWNIGDAYSGGRPGRGGIKPKDLALIPFRVALAAQADGWWVRSIVWRKAGAASTMRTPLGNHTRPRARFRVTPGGVRSPTAATPAW